ncbi:hypothetical protein, partial [Pseudomonas aeruginosa]|uniref:hypothetical protein n=1 Tax=Pseudomonas aeruginosa TaxID=287 RepID=UPI001CC33B08
MGRLLEGAQCATGGEAFSRSQKRHISDEWQQLSSPIKNNDEFLSFDEKIQSSRPLNSRPSAPKTGMSPSLSKDVSHVHSQVPTDERRLATGTR